MPRHSTDLRAQLGCRNTLVPKAYPNITTPSNWVKAGSVLASTRSSDLAWAASRRSKGSRCGTALTAVVDCPEPASVKP